MATALAHLRTVPASSTPSCQDREDTPSKPFPARLNAGCRESCPRARARGHAVLPSRVPHLQRCSDRGPPDAPRCATTQRPAQRARAQYNLLMWPTSTSKLAGSHSRRNAPGCARRPPSASPAGPAEHTDYRGTRRRRLGAILLLRAESRTNATVTAKLRPRRRRCAPKISHRQTPSSLSLSIAVSSHSSLSPAAPDALS